MIAPPTRSGPGDALAGMPGSASHPELAALEAQALFEEARRRQRRRRIRRLAYLVAVVAVVIGYVAARTWSTPPPAPTPSAAAPLAGSAWHAGGQTAWKHALGGNYAAFPSDAIACAGSPSDAACYVVIQANGIEPDGSRTAPDTPLGGSSLHASVFRSGDLGITWTRLALPTDTWLSSATTCSGAGTCAVAAVVGAGDNPGGSGQTVLLTTLDGRRWAVHDLPPGTGEIQHLACPTPSHCVVAAFAAVSPTTIDGDAPAAGVNRFLPTAVLTTDDGGATWSRSVLPSTPPSGRYSLSSVTCPTGPHCIAEGALATIVHLPEGAYIEADTTWVTLYSGDGGRTWTTSDRRPAFSDSQVACGDDHRCLRFESPGPAAGPRPPDVLSSDDAGRTWTTVLTVGLPPMSTLLDCSSAQRCIAATNDAGLLSTVDGGTRWTEVGVVPAIANGRLVAGSCLTTGICLVLRDTSEPPPALSAEITATVLTNVMKPTLRP
jgi:photosystem II stability/assembly factor-like uncharacterized protein